LCVCICNFLLRSPQTKFFCVWILTNHIHFKYGGDNSKKAIDAGYRFQQTQFTI